MSNEQIDQDTGSVDDKDLATPTSQGQAEPAVTANSATTEPDIRESLVKQLMQAPVDDKPEETAEPEKPEEVEESDPLEAVGEDSKTPVVEETKTPDVEQTTVDDDKRLSERTRKRIAELHSKAAFGDLITQTLTKAQIEPEEFSRWTNLAARLKKGDPTAVNELVATAKAFGYVEPTREAPAKTKTVDDVAEEIYARDFAGEVEGLNIAEPLARKHARKLAEMTIKTEKSEPVAPREQPQQMQAPAPRSVDPIREEALKTISAREAEYRTKVKGYTEIEANVVKRLRDEYGSRNPIEWVGGYNAIVREELRKAAPVQVKTPIQAVAGTQIRPKTAVVSTSAPQNTRDSIVQDIVSGKFARQ